MRIIKARELLRPASRKRRTRESRYVQISISGKWLMELGFKKGESVYITETVSGLLLSPTQPPIVTGIGIEALKEQYKALNIPTTRKPRPYYKTS